MWSVRIGEAIEEEDAEFIAACDPETVLAWCRVVRAARVVVVEAGRYAPDGVPVSPEARALYDALATAGRTG